MAALIPRKANPFVLGTNLDQLNAQRARTQAELARRSGSAATGWNTRLSQIDNAIKGFQPTTPTPTAQPTPTTPTNTTNPQTNQALFPDVDNFMPETYEGSSLYKFQRDKGLQDSEKFYASRGLTGSGAEVEGRNEFLTGLGAQEAQRAQGLAQTNADRYATLQENEAMRRERNSNESFNRLYNILGLAAQQNPIQYANAGNNQIAGIMEQISKLKANSAANNYRVSSGGGGYTPIQTPYPSSPDYSSVNLANIQGNSQNNNDWMNTITKLIGGLF